MTRPCKFPQPHYFSQPVSEPDRREKLPLALAFWVSSLSLTLFTQSLLLRPALAQIDAPLEPQPEFQSDLPVESAVPSAQELLAPAPVEPLPAEPTAPAPERSVELELNRSGEAAGPIDSLEGEGASSGPAVGNSAETLVNPNLAQQAESTFGDSGFIDNTPYRLGATDNPNVVLSERSSGCQAVVQPGQNVPSNLCAGSGDWSAAAYYGGAGPSGDLGLGVVYGRTTPSSKDFYNLTIRPPARLTSGKLNFLFPLSIPAAITSMFGWRIHPVMGESRFHSGTDLGAPLGTPVLAAFPGKIAIADFMGGYGLTVVIRHENDTEETLYGHLSEIFVKPGETIKQGEVIGRVGSTGLSTGPHLHFEFRKQTPNGWVVLDAGGAIESALGQFLNALKLGQAYPPQLATIRSTSFTKALEMAEKLDASTNQSAAPQAKAQPAALDGTLTDGSR
jgi:murein DD-endopeptidase MepM/ murein hydrolase activator NlpD